MRENEAYSIIRENFLANETYTHLAILPDDLIVTQYHWHQLIEDIREYDFPVVCGLCNLDQSAEHKGMLNVCINHLPSREAYLRTYEWIMEGSAEHKALLAKTPPIIKVKFAGFPFMFMRRDVVETVSFADDYEWNHYKLMGCCVDVIFCLDCHEQDIPIYCDLRCQMIHLKIDDVRVEGKKVDILPKHVYFSNAK